jgi:hypothetical protein
MVSDGTALITSLLDAYNDHDLRRYEQLHAPTSRISFAGVDGDAELEPWLDTLGRLFEALPDLAVRPMTMLTDTNTAVVELQQAGTHTGVLHLTDGDRALLDTYVASVPPTGRRIDVSGVVVLANADGRVTAERHHWPPFFLHEGLGLVTIAPTPTAQTRTFTLNEPRANQ